MKQLLMKKKKTKKAPISSGIKYKKYTKHITEHMNKYAKKPKKNY